MQGNGPIGGGGDPMTPFQDSIPLSVPLPSDPPIRFKGWLVTKDPKTLLWSAQKGALELTRASTSGKLKECIDAIEADAAAMEAAHAN